MKDASIVVGYL